MDKNTIKNALIKRFISEEATPGIAMQAKIRKEDGKINKAGVAAVKKDVTAYDKDLKKTDPDKGKMAQNKFNYNTDEEKEYHEDMEILNGQEMIRYDREPTKDFKDKAKEGIEGSSRMGNQGGKDMGNAEETWGAASDSFGKELVKRIKASTKKRADAEDKLTSLGDDIEVERPNVKHKPRVTNSAIAESEKDKATMDDEEDYEKISREVETGINPYSKESSKKSSDEKSDKNNNNKPKIKESMKRITFKAEFEGVNTTQKLGHALTLIPEGYKVNNKEFEMTDGNVSCRVRWEGTLNEGKAIIVQAANKTEVNEDMNRMKQLMGYKSQDTLGLVKGKSRVDENAAFGDIWKKTRRLLGESEDIEDADAVEGSAESLDDAVGVAKEATAHIEGSVSTDDGTQAPAPKKGEWEKINVPHAKEAKAHVEGSVAEEKKTEAPAPKEGNWEEIKKKSADATKDVESGKPTATATDKAKVVKENVEGEAEEDDDSEDDGNEPAKNTGIADTFNKPTADDLADDEIDTDAEPSAKAVKAIAAPALGGEEDGVKVPSKLNIIALRSDSKPGKVWLRVGSSEPIIVPAELADLARKNPDLAYQKMQDAADFAPEPEPEAELDEYGDEHAMPTQDAVAGLKPKM